MKTKLILTSMLAIIVATPAIAAVGDTNFEINQSDVSSCAIDVLGVDENTANAEAAWQALTYSCPAGTYLPDGDTWDTDNQYTNNNCATCPTGSYCAGSGSTPFTYSESADQGITACPSGYPNSSAHSSAESSCYRTCAASDVAHLKSGGTVSGRYYSGNNNQCEPADAQQCAGGYHYVAGFNPSTSLPATSQNGNSNEYHSHNNSNVSSNGSSLPTGGWSATWTSGTNQGTMTGIASCNSTSGSLDPRSTSAANTMNTSSSGQDCWCMPTSWTPSGGLPPICRLRGCSPTTTLRIARTTVRASARLTSRSIIPISGPRSSEQSNPVWHNVRQIQLH